MSINQHFSALLRHERIFHRWNAQRATSTLQCGSQKLLPQRIWAEAAPEHRKKQQFTPKHPRRYHQVQVSTPMAPAVTPPRANTAQCSAKPQECQESPGNRTGKALGAANPSVLPGNTHGCRSVHRGMQELQHTQGPLSQQWGGASPEELSSTTNYLCCPMAKLISSAAILPGRGCRPGNLSPTPAQISTWTCSHSTQERAPLLRSQLCSLAARKCEGNRAGCPGQAGSPVSPWVLRAASSSHPVQLRASCRQN